MCLSVCLSVFVCVCVSLTSDSSETTLIKLGRVPSSDMRMHHVLIIFTLTYIQGLTELLRKNNKSSISS